MSRFDDEGAPLLTRSVTDRWNLSLSNIQRVQQLQLAVLRRQREARSKRREVTPPAPESTGLEPLTLVEIYDEHGEKRSAGSVEGAESHRLDLKG